MIDGHGVNAAFSEVVLHMLVKLSEILYKLYSDDQQSVLEALRIVRLLDFITIQQTAQTITSGKPTQRPVFYNPSATVNALAADQQHLKLIAIHIKQKTDLVNNLRLISKIGDEQLARLAQLLTEEPEATIEGIPAVSRIAPKNGKPFLPLLNWGQQRDLLVRERS